MAEYSNPNKKRKGSMSTSTVPSPVAPPPSNLEKSSDFWSDDGNLILRTATKQYRVHRGVLAMHSTVFKDMFAIPQPSKQPNIEGVPVIDVTDSSRDWDLLLPTIYGLGSIFSGVTKPHLIELDLMISILRLGRKYNLERLKLQALEQLKSLFPDDLEKWDSLFSEAASEFNDLTTERISGLTNVAVELGLQRALPMALYTCLREAEMEDVLANEYNIGGLPWKTARSLALAQSPLLRTYGSKSMAWFTRGSVSADCFDPHMCLAVIKNTLVAMSVKPQVHYALDPPRSSAVCTHFDDLCKRCYAEAEESHLLGRKETFSELPSFFGLEPWEKLKDDF